ncbi:hypothetical protein [Leucobacter luti]|uniref:hypothetical protein n=1 Tax=Leucobacter luti TaxID=340320 RepID=UPI003D06B93E
MSDVALVALFSACATALVAFFGFLGSVYGPARAEKLRDERQRAQAEASRRTKIHDLKVQRAEKLSEAIVDAVGAGDWHHHAVEDRARTRFVATLEPGEGPVAEYVKSVGLGLGEESSVFERKHIALEQMEAVFGWLRGDVSIDHFTQENENRKSDS